MKSVEQGRDNSSLSTAEVLHNLVVEQRKELEDLRSTPIIDISNRSRSRRALFSWYKGTNSFREAYNKLVNFHCIQRGNKETLGFLGEFAGRVYQDVAYHFLASAQPNTSTLLSPKKTLEFYRKLYPHAFVMQNNFELDSLKGISVPDSLLIIDNRISAVCEYTLSGRENNFKEHNLGFQIDRRDFSDFFSPNSYHLFVVPEDAGIIRMKKQYPDAQFEQMPFTHKQFRDFIDSTYHFYRSSDGAATLPEVQTEAGGQLNRSVEQISNGKITPEHIIHLLNSVKNPQQFDKTVALLSRVVV